MTEVSLDELGPVDYVVVEFPAGASNFTGEMAAELLALVEAGTIRVIDALILTKDGDGSVDAMELSDVGDLGELVALEAQLAELLAADDVAHLAAAMDPGTDRGSAHLGEPVGGAVRRCGSPFGRAADRQRADSHPSDHRLDRGGQRNRDRRRLKMPMRPARVGRVGVIGAPVAKTAVVAAAVTPGPSPVAKAAVVGAAVSPGPSPVAKTAVVAAAVTPGRRRI